MTIKIKAPSGKVRVMSAYWNDKQIKEAQGTINKKRENGYTLLGCYYD